MLHQFYNGLLSTAKRLARFKKIQISLFLWHKTRNVYLQKWNALTQKYSVVKSCYWANCLKNTGISPDLHNLCIPENNPIQYIWLVGYNLSVCCYLGHSNSKNLVMTLWTEYNLKWKRYINNIHFVLDNHLRYSSWSSYRQKL